MALTSSGQIDLNAMHVEAGGTSGTQCSMNDTDIRGMISKASGAQMAFNEWYGASAAFELTGTSYGAQYTEAGNKINLTYPAFVKFEGSSSPYTSAFDAMANYTATTGPFNPRGFTLRDVITISGATSHLAMCLTDANYPAVGLGFGMTDDRWNFASATNYIEAYYNNTLIMTFSGHYDPAPSATSVIYWIPSTGVTTTNSIITTPNRTTANLWKIKCYP
jgi:hypothetical protein